MNGFHMIYFDPQTRLLVGAFPLLPVAVPVPVGSSSIACSLRFTARQDL